MYYYHDYIHYLYINTIILETLDPLQFAYRPNRSTDDAISIALHTALSHLDKRNTYVRMLFIDYSSAFNTIVPSKLLDFLTGHPQVVRVGNNTSATLILNTGAPQEFVISPLLYSLFTPEPTARHDSNTIIKFVDDTTLTTTRQPIGRRSETWPCGTRKTTSPIT